ncbi:hypothetical protein Ctha_0534 [Chloroherpeton thalassium ATCC 35110]|uniref:O-antigen polymerase n=1 Tax=Chloroherpeton thalassium (strain ATCC 35110 / GB-78) TaxID=517418 RepID=B3QV51_CHLT3|nr:hypothetical protein [Chloroherpeton thalassium]ACF13005.1 hypothetical protein Ctha_0534 [Chloroherpeton thalassium ATCC 35110]
MDPINFVIVFIGVVVIVFSFINSPLQMAMYIVAFQKIIDIFWFVKITVGGFELSIQRVVYTVLPIALFLVVINESQKKKIPFSMPLITVMIVFSTWILLAIIRSPYISVALPDFFKVAGSYVIFATGWFYFDSQEKFEHFAKVYIFSYIIPFIGFFLQLFGIFELGDIGVGQQLASNYGVEGQSFRYPGFYNDALTQAIYTFTVVPLCFYMVNNPENRKKLIYYIFILLSWMIIYYGFSRSGWLSGFIQIAAWLFLNKRYGVFVAMLSVSMIALFSSPFLASFFNDVIQSVEAGEIKGMTGRDGMWKSIMESFYQGSVIEKFVGKGLYSHSDVLDVFLNVETSGHNKGHSDLYEYIHDTGIIGVSIYFSLILAVFIYYSRILKQVYAFSINNSLSLKYLAWGAMFAFYLLNIVTYASRWPGFSWPFWFLAGFALKPPMYYIYQDQAMEEDYDEDEAFVLVNPQLVPH